MSQKNFGITNFLHIAHSYVNPAINNLADMRKYLIGWFCIEYKTTMNDERLLNMTVEELLVLFQMKRIHDDPNYYQAQVNPVEDDYEDWLKTQMGDNYVSLADQEKELKKLDQEFMDKLREEYPDEITTDFANIGKN